MSQPKNIQAPMPVGSTWQSAYAEGLQSGRFVANVMCRKKATEGILNSSFWGLFFTRTFASNFDDTTPFSIVAADGKRVWTMGSAKAESFSLRITKAQQVGLQVVFVSPAPGSDADQTVTTYGNQIDTSPPMMGYDVTYTGFTGPVFGVELTYANNHQANTGGHNGSKYLSSWDAGPISSGFSVTTDVRTTSGDAFADGASIGIAMAGTTTTTTLTLDTIVSNNPNDRDVSLGQVYSTDQCLVLGDASNRPLTAAVA